MIFNIITIFPKIFDSYFGESILARAQKENIIEIKIHNLRDYTTDKHKTVDDTPYGGGAGMVLKVEPIYNSVQNVLNVETVGGFKDDSINIKGREKDNENRIILFSAKGKKYTQADAQRLSGYKNLILICGRYEGVDERVAENIIDEEFSIGEYVLTGGEIPAMLVVDSISRLLPGVLGNSESLLEESFNNVEDVQNVQIVENGDNYNKQSDKTSKAINHLEYPHYTKPEDFNGWKVPEILLSGNHKEIEKWKKQNSS